MSNFWQKLKKPFLMLAPMYDVTDEAFRQTILKCGRLGPDVFFTEFVSADGLASVKGRSKLLRELYFKSNEHPIVAQIFGSKPDNIYEASKLVAKLGFDGIDINMGCPDRAINKQGAGAALIKNPSLAREIILAAKRGAGKLPVSVKTRIGFNKIEITEWAREVFATKPAMVTFHLRTKKEMSLVPAHWEVADKLVAMGHEAGVLVSANGDVTSVTEAKEKAKRHKLDGVMLGRAVFGNPWLYTGVDISKMPIKKKLAMLISHTKLFEKLYCPGPTNKKLFAGHTKNFAVMKKHFKAYVKDFPGASELRQKLMETKNSTEVSDIIKNFLG